MKLMFGQIVNKGNNHSIYYSLKINENIASFDLSVANDQACIFYESMYIDLNNYSFSKLIELLKELVLDNDNWFVGFSQFKDKLIDDICSYLDIIKYFIVEDLL
ncbi:MAG: hypothetical protein ACRC92_08040 [Peptostreptococcaceae bacterium]